MTLSPLIAILCQFVLVLATAPLAVGLVRKIKARYQNRRGASVLQPYIALAALWRKEMTMPEYSSWVFRFVPYAVLAATAAFALVVPTLVIGALPPALTAQFLAVGLLALASSFMVLGGLDTSSAFGSMGSSREMTLVTLGEAAFFVILATLGLVAGTGNLSHVIAVFAVAQWTHLELLLSPTLVALLFVLLAENTRYPVDNPATHLELTMVHEAMILEYSGPYLAMLEYASMLRLTVFSVFFANLIAPFSIITTDSGLLELAVGAVVFVVKLGCVAFVVATIESLVVKMRFYRMQEYFSLAFLFALAGAATVFLQMVAK